MPAEKTETEGTEKSGFVAIIGLPNAGKSTLMNAALGEKLSIVTPKPQTTRRQIVGIFTRKDTQIVFLDTPGIIAPHYELHRAMMEQVEMALAGADVVLFLFDLENPEPSMALFESIRNEGKLQDIPVVVALNKIDALFEKTIALPLMERFMKEPGVQSVLPISAKKGDNLPELLDILTSLLPVGEFYYDADMLSELPERFFVAELIREVVFKQYKKEIPYSTEVQVVEFKERDNGKWYINAEIIVERDTQKAIIIGKGATKLKEIGAIAREAIEKHLDTPVFLELFVKVRNDWRNNKSMLTSFGY